MQPPVPTNEDVRLAALHALNVLDTPPETDFDDIVALASDLCGAPISLVSLVDTDRQWFKAKIGIDAEETNREVSFCAHAIVGNDLMVVPDARIDARFANNPLVRASPGVRFYAGAPLVTTDGNALGTLCIVDHNPHRPTPDQLRALRALGRQVSEHLELRRLSVAPDSAAEPEPRAVDLAYLLEGRITELRPVADARNSMITLAIAGTSIVRADPRRLGHALDYVLFTALKAAPAGARLAVRVSDRPSPSMEISHAGGSIMPAWQADLGGLRTAEEPLPAAAAAVLRSYDATVQIVSEALGSPDACFQIHFPSY